MIHNHITNSTLTDKIKHIFTYVHNHQNTIITQTNIYKQLNTITITEITRHCMVEFDNTFTCRYVFSYNFGTNLTLSTSFNSLIKITTFS